MKIINSIIVILFAFVSSAFAHGLTAEDLKNESYYWMKFKAKDKYERSEIANLGVTIEAVIEDSVIAMGTQADLDAAKKTGRLEVFFKLSTRTLDFPSYDSNFHNYTELKQELESLAAQYPQILKLSAIGQSLEGRDMFLVTISSDENDLSRPAVFFMGGHHAREHVSIEMPLQLIQYFAQEYASGNPRIVSLLNSRTVYVVPMVNPDGAEYDIESGSYKLWRKNRRNNGGNVYGVDLNRNYGYGWGGGGASTSPRQDTYRGPSAFSEPETQAVKAFFESHRNITIDLTFHTFSQLILYPWGHKYDHIEDQNAYMVHKTMAEKMATWNGYTPQQSSELYIASGDTTDWAFGELGIISFTFELDPAMTPDKNFFPERGFYPGQSVIQPVFQKNLEPALYLLEHADNPYRVLDTSSESYGLQSPILK